MQIVGCVLSAERNFGAEGETRTHGGFPTPYKSVAIATMRLQPLFLFMSYYSIIRLIGQSFYIK